MEADDIPEKFVADNKSKKPENKVTDSVTNLNNSLSIENLPNEVMLKVFSNLNPQELCRSAQVSKRWNSLAMDGSLWTELYPVSWAKGDWNAKCGVDEEDTVTVEERLNAKSYDEDADVDETDDWNSEALEIQHQSYMLTSMCKHLLPRVGRTIRHCDLAYSKGLTNGSLYKILSLCPNLEYLDLTQTRVSDLGFKGFKKEGSGEKLRHLDLSGCLYITDNTLKHLSSALRPMPCHMTETADHVTSTGSHVMNHAKESDVKDEGCVGCKESRKNEDSGSLKVDKHEESQEKSCKECLNSRGCPSKKQGNSSNGRCCGKYEKGCAIVPDTKLQADNCKVDKCMSCGSCDTGMTSKGNSTGTNGGVYCCRNTKAGKHGGCNDDKSNDNVETPLVNIPDKIHNKECDNDNTESQDRSWIKQGEGQYLERSRTVHVDLSPGDTVVATTGRSVEVKQSTVRNDEKNQLNLSKSNHGDIEDVPDIKIIQSETSPGLTFLPEELLLSSLSRECDVDSKVTTKTFPPAGSGLENDFVNMPEGSESKMGRALEFLSLSGCYQITDTGLNYLTSNGGLPRLRHLDLSGCLNVAGEAVCQLVNTASCLDPAQLFYCDNILDGPYADTASGCQNLQCNSRVCCRCGE